MTDRKSPAEKELEDRLAKMLGSGLAEPARLERVALIESTSDARTMADLVGTRGFKLIKDNSEWNQHRDFLVDISGNMTPDLVVQCDRSAENRILIEVKSDSHLRYDTKDSQIIRYLIHLLATTLQRKNDHHAIRRAILLAAPRPWLDNEKNRKDWSYFLDQYRDLAGCFDVTLARIELS